MNKNKIVVLVSGIVVILLMILGISFAVFRFGETSDNQQLVLGDIWMKYTESNGISLENALPGDEYTNYFEFTITGTNTYTKKDIFYDISLTHGDIPAGKEESNRVEDKYLKFKLTEVVGNTETEIFTEKTYDDLTNKRVHVDTISKSTSTYSKTYRLYMVISEELTYGNSSDAILTTEEFGKIFGSIKVNVTGNFNEKEVELTASKTMIKAIADNTDASCNPIVEEDGIIYFSGTNDCVDFNYVWYSGKLWRITAIYPDGTMKMITDDVITAINWGATSTISSSDLTSAYSTSYMREWLNQEFLPTLYNYENIIVEDAGWYSITDSNDTPTKPTGDYTLTDPVGLLNAYEYYMSYKNTNYTNGYLNIGYFWWLITPYGSSYVRHVNGFGTLNVSPYSDSLGMRPSINLKSTTELSRGSGTKDEPYRIKGDQEEAIVNTTLLNERMSGEYVKLGGATTEQVFRIVDTELVGENLTTKIVLNDYIKESDSVLTKNFSGSSSHELWSEVSATDTTYWRGYLNTTWLGTLNTNMLVKGTYYLGYHANGSYKTTVCNTISSEVSVKGCIENGTVVSNTSSDDYVGLLRVGEMFASQTSDYTYLNGELMWLITPYTSSDVRDVHRYGILGYDYPSGGSIGVRPTINLKSAIVIKSGSGTKQDPFVVGLPN